MPPVLPPMPPAPRLLPRPLPLPAPMPLPVTLVPILVPAPPARWAEMLLGAPPEGGVGVAVTLLGVNACCST